MRFAIFTLGCKTNQYESELMRESFLKEQFTEVAFKDVADVYVINSCVVTEKAERETRKAIYEAQRKNPKAQVILTGCYTKLYSLNKLGKVIFYRGSRSGIGAFVKTGIEKGEDKRIESFFGRVRAFVKVEEGCDNFCTYCIVPVVRGHSIKSKPKEAVLDEVKELVDKGFKEIVLTGTEIGKYGQDIGTDIAGLVSELKGIEGLMRLRISSIHPKYVDDSLIEEFLEPKALVPHLHISLQSGDNTVLKKMNRGYTVESYLEIVEKLRKIDLLFSISTDVIVGFPQETEEAFFNTLSIIKKVEFSRVHVFRYSRRPFTPAYYFKESVSEITKTVRSKRLREFADAIANEYKERFIGAIVPVLVEEKVDSILYGWTPHYVKVFFKGNVPVNTLVKVRVTSVEGGMLKGELIPS